MYNDGYPTARFTWSDTSGASTAPLFSPQSEGLCVPFAFIMAERGIPGAIYYGGSAELTQAFGSTTFDPSSPYFNAATQMIGDAMAAQGTEVMRLVDPAAQTATLGLFVAVTHTPVVQYQKDATGARILDNNGHYKPVLAADGVTHVTQPGMVVKWSVRALASNEVAGTLAKTTVTNGSVTTVTYPVLDFEVSSQGLYGNRQGFKLYSTGTQDSTIAQAIGSMLYRFAPVELPSNVSMTATYIPDVYGAPYNDVSFKSSAVYGPTATNYAFNYVMGSRYADPQTGDNLLPFNINAYGANIGLIGTDALTLSPELGSIDPYLVDLMSGLDGNGNLYDHIQIDAGSSSIVNSAAINYAQGGTDGDTSWAMYEQLVAVWLAGSDHGEFSNLQQHPMTHFYDPGFTMNTKPLLLNMLDLRDNFKIDLSTQDITQPVNTKAEDISVGQALLFRAQMHPESIINGVGCCRVGIYAQAALLVNSSPYGGVIPFTYNRMIQRRNLDGGSYIKGSSGGFPNSEITSFRKPAWVADDQPSQALTWSSCINAVRHASRTEMFYPSLRTVYPNDTSLLSDDEVADRIVYMFKIVRRIWAQFVGTRRDAKKLYPLIQDAIANACNAAFSADNIKVTPKVFQSAEDANLGYAISINLAVTGNLPVRVFNFNVEVQRAAA